jgi:hypothetical protein
VIVAVCEIVPLVPVTVTVYVPAGVEAVVAIVNVEVAVEPGARLTLAGAKLNVIPVAAGATVAESPTVPAKPSSPVATIVVEPVDPAGAVTLVGLIDRAKSWMA